MSVRRVRIWPDPVLAEVARPVAAVDAPVRALIDDLFATMYAESGIGLACNQIGIARRVMVVDLDPTNAGRRDPEVRAELEAWGFAGPLALVNPEIVAAAGRVDWEEGCLSVPGITESVRRHAEVTVAYLDRAGTRCQLAARGLFAVALQHELDHLDGRVFVDRLSRLKRDVIRRKVARLRGESAAAAGGP